MLEDASVCRPEQVLEVLPLVGPDAGDVGVEARLPAPVAGTAAELDQVLAAVRLAIGLLQPAIEPRLAAHALQVAAHPREVQGRPRDEEHLGPRLTQARLAPGLRL